MAIMENHRAPGEVLLSVQDLRHSFATPSSGEIVVLDDVSLDLHQGEIVGLLGRSGSGKSTLLRIAGGLMRPTSGEVRYRGAPLTAPAEGISLTTIDTLIAAIALEHGANVFALDHDFSRIERITGLLLHQF